MFKNIDTGTKLVLKDLVDYQPGQVVSRTLAQNDKVSMTLFSFDQGEELSTHSSGGDALVTVLDGKGKFVVDGVEHILEPGESLIMPKNVPHSVYAIEPFKMELIVSF